MHAIASEITGVSIVRLTQAQIKENIKAPRHSPLWGEIQRWPVDFPHKVPIMLYLG